MRASPIVMLFLALVFGGGAVYAAKAVLQNQIVQSAQASGPSITTILVASTPLRFGDKLGRDNLREIAWPDEALPAGAFANREVFLKDGDRYVMTAIETNEPVLQSKVTGPGQRATLSAALDPGMKAVTIRVNDVLGVAGFVLPGDRVDVMLTRTLRTIGSDGGQDTKSYVDVLIQGVQVLAVDQVADDRAEEALVAKAVTLQVDTGQAQKLTLAANVGQLSLALRNPASATAEDTRRITVADLGESEEINLPLPATPVLAVEAPKRPILATVGVVRGVERAEYQVPSRR